MNAKINSLTPRLIVRYGYIKGTSNDSRPRRKMPSLVADKRGWTWTVEVRPNEFHFSRLGFDNVLGAESSFPKKIQNLFAKNTIRGADVSWRVAAKPAGEGYFLSGDAASVLNPISSHGVLKALMSGYPHRIFNCSSCFK